MEIAMDNVPHVLAFCFLLGSTLAVEVPTLLAYQDSLGQYSFGYSAPGSARSEIRTLNGETRGSYSYIDDSGVIQTTEYTADSEHGFRVAATNLPMAPVPIQNAESVIGSRGNDQVAETERKIGETNIFLKEPQLLNQNLVPANRKIDQIGGTNIFLKDPQLLNQNLLPSNQKPNQIGNMNIFLKDPLLNQNLVPSTQKPNQIGENNIFLTDPQLLNQNLVPSTQKPNPIGENNIFLTDPQLLNQNLVPSTQKPNQIGENNIFLTDPQLLNQNLVPSTQKPNQIGENNIFLTDPQLLNQNLVPSTQKPNQIGGTNIFLKDPLLNQHLLLSNQKPGQIGENNIFLKDPQILNQNLALSQKPNKIGEHNIFLKDSEAFEKNFVANQRIHKIGEDNIFLKGSQFTGENVKLDELKSQMTTKEIPKLSSSQIVPFLKQSSIPIFRISQGNIFLDPSNIQVPINLQGSSSTPASTIKLNYASTKEIQNPESKESTGTPIGEQEKLQEGNKEIDSSKEVTTPLNILRPYSSLVKVHLPNVHYFIYKNA